MKKIVFIASIFYSLSVTAQNNFILPDSLSKIFINSKVGSASGSIPQKFMNKFIFPGFITDELKNAASDNLKNFDYFGASVLGNFNLLFSEKKDSSKTSNIFGFGLGAEYKVNTSFSRDLFNLTFFGNQPFNNKILDLNNTDFNSLIYSYLELSLGKSSEKNNLKTSIWMDFGFLIGHRFTDINFGKGSLFTEENGDYLELTLSESSIAFSDTSNKSLVQGLGAKIDLFYSRQNTNSILLISAENIGGIFWQNTLHTSIDTIFNFEGIQVGNIFELSDSVLSEVETFDSIIPTVTKNLFKPVPVEFSGYYRRNLNFIYFDFLTRYKLFSNYKPYVRAGINFGLPVFKPGATFAFGGYTGFQFGLNTDIELVEKLKIQIGTNNLLGAIIPSSATSFDGYFGIRFTF